MAYEQFSIIDFSGGLNNKMAPNLIQDHQCVDVQNCIVSVVGRLQRRKGQKRLNSSYIAGNKPIQGLYAYYYGNGTKTRKLIAVADGVAYYYSTNGFNTIKSGLSATAPVLFETCVNYMVGMNGVDKPWKYDGASVTDLQDAPATGSCPVLFAEKLFCIADKDTVRWSNSFEPESWGEMDDEGELVSPNVWTFDKGDGDELSALFVYNSGKELLVCKKRSIHRLVGTSMADFRANKAENRYGVAGPRAGVVVDPYFYYISVDGIFRWDGMESANLTAETIPLTWEKVNKNNLTGAVAACVDNRIWFCVPEGENQTTNNLVLVYDLTYKSWWIFRGIAASCFTDFDDGTSVKTYSGDAAGGYIIQQSVGYNDIGAAITSYWVGKNFDGSDPVRIKKFKKAFAVDVKELNDASFSYSLDGSKFQALTARTDIKSVRKYGIPSGSARYFQPRFTHAVVDKDFCLSGFEVLYKLKKQK